ncbi:MAG TPA: outer membrane beta-barrel protein, partial [Methylomirabilota bacterium]|nr:outer membrane beta-barrel protein [Methylomirabilota bacterium]
IACPCLRIRRTLRMGGFSSSREISLAKASHLFGELPLEFQLNLALLRFNFMGRYGLSVSPEFKNGRTQLYAGAGPAILITKIKDKEGFIADPAGQSDTDTSLGVDVKAGLRFLITKNWDIFAEYRFLHGSAEVKFRDDAPPPTTEKVSTTINAHLIGGGISFHFDP